MDDLLSLIRCPLTLETLSIASLELLEQLEAEQKKERLFFEHGTQVEDRIEAGLVNGSLSCFILVRNGIPDLTREYTIPIDHLEIS